MEVEKFVSKLASIIVEAKEEGIALESILGALTTFKSGLELDLVHRYFPSMGNKQNNT